MSVIKSHNSGGGHGDGETHEASTWAGNGRLHGDNHKISFKTV
jgi:hypothetical protein